MRGREGRLQTFLANLPEGSALRLTAAMERERLAGNNGLPHEAILAGLRPALASSRLRPPRVPTPLRLFCKPFEDLIFPGHRSAKQVGRIARSSILPIWDWLGTDLMGQELGEISGRLAKYILSGDIHSMRDTTMELHGRCGEALSGALAGLVTGEDLYGKLAKRLGNALVLEDARDICRVLEIADDILQLLDRLPEPIEILDEGNIADVRRAYEVIANNSSDHAPYIIFVTLGRMRRPWEILRVLGKLTHNSTDALASRTDLYQCGDLLFSDMENTVEFFARLDFKQADLADIRQQIDFFVNLSHGITSELGIRRDGEWGKRLMEARAKVASRMEQIIGKAGAEILALLPFKKNNSLDPDLSKPLEEDQTAHAVALASFLDEVRHLAPAGAFSSPFNTVMDDVLEHLERYSPRIIEALRDADAGTRPQVEARVSAILRLAAVLLGPDDVHTMERRAALARESAA